MYNHQALNKMLKIILFINAIIVIPLMLRKRPIKDWAIVYLFSAVTNGIIDQIICRFKIVKYPIRLLSKIFNINILFDFFIYPTFDLMYNQWTYKDGPIRSIYKLFLLTTPVFIIELWTEKNTRLLQWSKKWKWYHSYFSIIIKSLFTRIIISFIRKADHKT